MPKIYVPNLAEFVGLVENARQRADCTVRELAGGYTMIEGEAPLHFSRREIGARPAIWYSMFSGGLDGRLVDFEWNDVTIVDA